MNNSQLINQTSGKTEWYTPPEIIELARKVMGSIDLDPASSYLANEVVKAKGIFIREDDGLQQEWFGNVWMNHPFSRENNPRWINKIVNEYELGHTHMSCCITYSSTSELWFQPLFQFPICFIRGRTNYIDPATGKKAKGVTKGSCVTFINNDYDSIFRFVKVFSNIGSVMLPGWFVYDV